MMTSGVKQTNRRGWQLGKRRWWIVVGCMLNQAVVFGIAVNVHPQFISYVVAGEGFTLASFSVIFTIGTLVTAIFSPLIGYLYGKVNAKWLFLMGAIFCGGGFMAFAGAQTLWQFYLIGSLVQLGAAMVTAMGVPFVLNAWFTQEMKGKVMGLTFAGGSVGNMLWQALAATSLAEHGYKWSYVVYGLLVLGVGVLNAVLLIRLPTAAERPAPFAVEVGGGDPQGYRVGEVKRMRQFWLFVAGIFCIGLYVAATAVQYPAYLRGYLQLEATVVGTVGAFLAFFSLLGNVAGGILFDKLGAQKTLGAAFVLAAAACLLLNGIGDRPVLAFLFAGLQGLSVFAYMLGPAYLTGKFFGQKDYGAILGLVNLAFAVGFATGASIFGLLADQLGYRVAWGVVLGFIILGYSFLLLAARGMKKAQTVG